MKIGIVQSNAVVGDFPSNVKRLRRAYRDCLDRGAEIVVSPEFALVGYPPGDLLQKSEFIDKCAQALDFLATEIGEIPFLVGYVVKTAEGKLQNALALLENGNIHKVAVKQVPASWNCFPEDRYLTALDENEPLSFTWKDRKIAAMIGEEWQEKSDFYQKKIQQEKATLLIQVAASPFYLGVREKQEAEICRLGRELQIPVISCHSVGANDSLVFAGSSLVANERGELIFRGEAFQEQCAVVELSKETELPQNKTSAEEEIWGALVLGLRDYLAKTGIRSVCLGLSGGIDSALAAAVAAEAIGPENVYGLTLPSPYSSGGSVSDSFALAELLGIHCRELSIADSFTSLKNTLQPLFGKEVEGITEENIQARIRGLLLMAYANEEGHMVLTTSNRSELLIGYCTIYGDMCGGVAILADLPKTMVFRLSRWLNREREVIPWSTIEKPPSAELRPGQKDQDSLPEYEVLDGILEAYIDRRCSTQKIVDMGYDENTVRQIQRRVNLSAWKRRQAALIISVMCESWRNSISPRPIVHRFDG